MKNLFTVFVFITSMATAQFSFARQYTQCSRITDNGDTDLHGVINLPQLEKGTLFLTLGAETDVSSLYHIELVPSSDLKNNFYQTTDSPYPITVIFPKAAYNKPSNNLELIIREGDSEYIFSCFSRIYPD
jgi:hypothetical protein